MLNNAIVITNHINQEQQLNREWYENDIQAVINLKAFSIKNWTNSPHFLSEMTQTVFETMHTKLRHPSSKAIFGYFGAYFHLISTSKALWAIPEQRTLSNLAGQNTVTRPRAVRIEPTISGCSGHALLSARVQMWTNLFSAARTTLCIYDEATQALPVVCWEKLVHRLVTSLSLLLCISHRHTHTGLQLAFYADSAFWAFIISLYIKLKWMLNGALVKCCTQFAKKTLDDGGQEHTMFWTKRL